MRRSAAAAISSLGLLLSVSAQKQSPAVAYLTRDEARPVFDALEIQQPASADWSDWIARFDRQTRSRIAAGDETSVVNLLLYGTSFTKQPRIASSRLDRNQIETVLRARLDDFVAALSGSGSDERLELARLVVGRVGPVRARLLSMVERAIGESEIYAKLDEKARALGDSRLEFAERSTMFSARGLASDTSLRVNFAVEAALNEIRNSHRGHLCRVAIVGPGLDFVDKQEGYDFYAPQTIQPFALADSLIRLGLCSPGSIAVTTFDLSQRVNRHLEHAVARSKGGSTYLLHLPLDGAVSWTSELLSYWRELGANTGGQVPVTIPPGLGPLRLRAVAVRPEVVARIVPRDLNVTAQRLVLPDNEQFDLIVGTNVFVYYDRLQQGLAMAAVARMLRHEGWLVTNNALVEVPANGLRSMGYTKVLYSNREEDGDLVIRYLKTSQ